MFSHSFELRLLTTTRLFGFGLHILPWLPVPLYYIYTYIYIYTALRVPAEPAGTSGTASQIHYGEHLVKRSCWQPSGQMGKLTGQQIHQWYTDDAQMMHRCSPFKTILNLATEPELSKQSVIGVLVDVFILRTQQRGQNVTSTVYHSQLTSMTIN